MESYRNRLKVAMLAREKTQELLSNIEQRKQSGTLATDQYDILKADYQKKMAAAVSEISAVKGDIKAMLQNLRDRMDTLNRELEELRARHDAGEFSLGRYQKSEKKILLQINEIKREIPGLQLMADMKSSSQLPASYPGAKPAFPRWGIIVLSVLVAVVVIAGAGFAAYKLLLEPKGYRIPGLSVATDNITPRPGASDNTTGKPAGSDNMTLGAGTSSENATASQIKWAEVIAAVEKSTVAVTLSDTTASGVVVGNNGSILTSRHNIKPKASVIVETQDRIQHRAKVIDNYTELSLVKTISDNITAAVIKMGDSSLVKEGDEVAIVSCSACFKSSAAARVSSIVKITGDGTLHIGMDFVPCYAGGAIINKDGELVALVIGSVELDGGRKGMFAVPINPVKELITTGNTNTR